MKASLKNYRQSPRKVRLVASALVGKRVPDALVYLSFLPKRAALPLRKLLDSAIANAKQSGTDTNSLAVTSLRVDKGIVLKRMMPRARGSGFRINKRTSHVSLVLGEPKLKKSQAPNSKSQKSRKQKVIAKV